MQSKYDYDFVATLYFYDISNILCVSLCIELNKINIFH